MFRILAGAMLAGALALGCGARTGLELPAHDPPDTGVRSDTGLNAGPICAPDVSLLPAHAEVLLVLDRSGSMTRALASSATTRWDALHFALGLALPAFDASVAFGAAIFPTPDATLSAGTVCDVGASLDVGIGIGGGAAILGALESHGPSGGTPTTEAIQLAARALAARARSGVPQSIVLATDGGPNCDPADRAEPWFGQAPETCAESGVDPHACLDTPRTEAAIGQALAMGVPTYVIAMDVSESYLVEALRAMARAGGRRRTDASEPYYDVRNPDDLRAAFGDIATRVSRCSFFPDGRVDGEAAVLVVGETRIERDESRTEGWTLGASGTFDLYGEACALAMRDGATVRILGACR